MKKLMIILTMLLGMAPMSSRADSFWKDVKKEFPDFANSVEGAGDTVSSVVSGVGRYAYKKSNIVYFGTNAVCGTYDLVSGGTHKGLGTVKSGFSRFYNSGVVGKLVGGTIGVVGTAVGAVAIGGIGYKSAGLLMNNLGKNWLTCGLGIFALDIALGSFREKESSTEESSTEESSTEESSTEEGVSMKKAACYAFAVGLAMGTMKYGAGNLFEQAKSTLSNSTNIVPDVVN